MAVSNPAQKFTEITISEIGIRKKIESDISWPVWWSKKPMNNTLRTAIDVKASGFIEAQNENKAAMSGKFISPAV